MGGSPWEDYQQSAQPPQSGPWADYKPPEEDDSSHPFINHFVSSVASSVLEKALRNMVETGKTPSLFGYASQVPGMFQSGEEASIKGGAQIESQFMEKAGILSPDEKQTLQNKGLYSQQETFSHYLHNDGEPLTFSSYQNAVVQTILNSPIASLAQAEFGTLMSPVAPLFDIGMETLKKEGASKLTLDTINAGLTVSGVAHFGGVRGKTAEALENHVIGNPESVFMGEKEPQPVMSEVAHKAAEASAPSEAPQQDTASAFDNNAVARNLSPDVFREYDALQVKQQAFRDQIEDLRTQRDAEINQKYAAEIDSLKERVDDAESRGKQTLYKDILDKKIAERDSALADAGDTAEMAALREQIQQADYRRRDLAPQVSAAYRAAEEYRPVGAAPEADQPAPPPPPQSETEIPAAENKIAEPLSKDLQALGRPEEEANAAATLIAAHYQAISDMGWAKGTADEIYAKYAPELRQGKDRVSNQREFTQAKGRELEQPARGKIRLASDDSQAIITLFKRADASTFIHETGHAWLDEMERFAKADDAPQSLLDAHKTVREWLGAKEGEEVSRAQHEKFARGFERYMMEGVAPSRGLAQVFAKFKEWLSKIYQTVQKLRSPITDDIRDVFDRLLSANPEKTILAPDHEPGKMAADIHEADATTTPPEEKDRVGDNVEKEIDATAKLHAPEIADAIKAAETGNLPKETSGDTIATPAGERPGQGGAPEESGAVAAGSGEPEAGGAGNAVSNGKPTEASRRSELIDKAGNIRLDLLTNEEDIRDLIHQIANEQGGFADARGPAVTQKDISDFADDLGIQESKVNLDALKALTRADGIPLAFRIRAGRVALKQAADAVTGMMANAEHWSEDDIVKYAEAKARLVMIAKTVSGITAEWGRAGHAFRDISGDMKAAQDITEFLQSATGRTPDELRQEAILGSKLQTSKQVAKYVKESTQPTFVDRMLWYRNMCLLSGPVTHAVYMEANLINLVARPLLEIPVQAKLGELRGAQERVYAGESGEMLYALGPALSRAWGNAADSWKEQVQVMPGASGTKKYNSLVFQQQMIPGKFGAALNAVGRSIGALHSFVYTLAYESNIAGLSYRQAMKEGLEPGTTQFAARINDLKTNQPPDMMDQASTSALTEMNMGKSGKILGLLSATINSNPYSKFLFPFIKMELNVKKQTYLERTPLGFLNKDIRANLLGANGELARDVQQGKMIATTAAAGVVFTVASQFINADGPTDPNKNRVWRLTHVPNSIQIGDSAFSLKGLGRLGSLLQLGAAMKESVSGWEKDDGEHLAAAFAENVSKVIADGSFAQSMKNTLDFAFHPSVNAGQFIQNFATQFLPFSVGMGQLAHQVDPFLRDTKTESGDESLGKADGIIKAAMSKIPGLSTLLEHRYDMFGQPISRDSDYYDRYKDDTTVQRMNALHMGVGALRGDIFGVKLNDQEYADYSQTAGILTKETLDRLITADFANHPLQAQIQAIHEVITMSREQAKQMLMQKYPEIRDKAIEFQRQAHNH